LTLADLDECGCSPSQPVTYRWTRAGRRKPVPDENPCHRRVNALGILIAEGPEPMRLWDRVPRSLTSPELLTVLQDGPRRGGRRVVVLDHGSIHVSQVITDAVADLRAHGIEFSYLPAYSPELKAIEPIFGGSKHHGLPERRYQTGAALMDAIDPACTEAEDRLHLRCQSSHQLRPAA
jgi:DDE superfamily endonuclease